jgi:hypothetical protein
MPFKKIILETNRDPVGLFQSVQPEHFCMVNWKIALWCPRFLGNYTVPGLWYNNMLHGKTIIFPTSAWYRSIIVRSGPQCRWCGPDLTIIDRYHAEVGNIHEFKSNSADTQYQIVEFCQYGDAAGTPVRLMAPRQNTN